MTKQETKGFPEAANAILKKLQANKESLHITRMPKKTREEFIAWANEEYCGDFGFALKALWDDQPKADVRTMMDMVKNLEERITNLELATEHKSETKDHENSIRLCNGSIKKRCI